MGGFLWNIADDAVKYGVAYVQGCENVFVKTFFYESESFSLLDSIIGVTHAPMNGALWYVRFLILIFLLAPIWLALFRWSRWAGVFLGLVLILWSPLEGTYAENFILPILGLFSFKLNSLGWILLGIGVSRFHLEEWRCGRGVFFFAMSFWLVSTWIPLIWEAKDIVVPQSIILFHRLSPIFYILWYWEIGNLFSRLLPPCLPICFSFGFWIYCMHHPITGYVGAVRHLLIGRSLLSDWVGQFTHCVVVFFICYGVGLLIHKWFPRAYAILTGGRVHD